MLFNIFLNDLKINLKLLLIQCTDNTETTKPVVSHMDHLGAVQPKYMLVKPKRSWNLGKCRRLWLEMCT